MKITLVKIQQKVCFLIIFDKYRPYCRETILNITHHNIRHSWQM